MNEQFDFIEGKYRAEAGMKDALESYKANDWKTDAWRWFMALSVGDTFSADDMIRAIGLPDTTHNNLVGAWFNSLSKQRRIVFTGQTKKSHRVDRHAGDQRVWMVI